MCRFEEGITGTYNQTQYVSLQVLRWLARQAEYVWLIAVKSGPAQYIYGIGQRRDGMEEESPNGPTKENKLIQ